MALPKQAAQRQLPCRSLMKLNRFVTVQLPLRFYLFAQHNYTDRIPLNDGNTEYAAGYHLVQARIGWVYKSSKRFRMEICAGVDNLLNESYSLGNDLNAIGNRY
jgi:iron complex outermembrane receptor protein